MTVKLHALLTLAMALVVSPLRANDPGGGAPNVIQPTIRYDAHNPFLRPDYVGETNTDTDFEPGTLTTLFTFANQTGEGVRETLGGGNANFRNVIESRRPAGNLLTVLLYGGDGQYLTYGSEHADPAVHPALVITNPGHVIHWQCVAGLSFKIQRSGNLTAWSDLSTVAGTNGLNYYTDASPLPGRNLYRIVLLP